MKELDDFKFAQELLMVTAKEAVDRMAILDVRIPAERITYFCCKAQAHLASHAECLVPATMATGTTSTSIKIAGTSILLNNRWGPQMVLLRFDPSQLGVVDDIVLKMKWSSSILAT